jgi:short chain dehydrogenase
VELGLAGRRAVVTGGSKGIGQAIAAELMAEGAAVTICSRHPDELDVTAAELMGRVTGAATDWLREFMLVTSLLVLLPVSRSLASISSASARERWNGWPSTQSVWLILFGFYISRDHYRSKVAPSGFKFSEKSLYTREMFDERRKEAGEGAR